MSEKDFKRIVRYENKKGNLSNGKFLLKIPRISNNSYDEIYFDLSEGINLSYEDELWLQSDGKHSRS